MIIESAPWTDDIHTAVHIEDIAYWQINRNRNFFQPWSKYGTVILGKWKDHHYQTWLSYKNPEPEIPGTDVKSVRTIWESGEEPGLAQSYHILCKALKNEPDHFRYWKDSIAMAFKNAYDEEAFVAKINYNKEEIHRIANAAATRFLNQLIDIK
jgi:hypothetical protein